MANVLIIDDDDNLCEMLVDYLNSSGYSADHSITFRKGLKNAQLREYDVVLLDVLMPDGNGLHSIPKFKALPYSPEVIIITGTGDPNGAAQAIKNGAWSYLEKPHVVKDLLLHLLRALQYREEKRRTKTVPISLKRDNIIGSCPEISSCLDKVAQAAGCDTSVLITGETGTGKEIFAQAIHANSNRSSSDFVIVDCASLPEHLVESTLFGHTKGSFTSADQTKQGLVKSADGGTLFLDEVAELPLGLQKKFLRVLQENTYRPVGDTKEVKSNFRVIAATNRNLNTRVKENCFRNDLLFRLQGITINLPPLRARKKDIKGLTVHYIEKICYRYGLDLKGLSPDFIDTLCLYNWPGNVRELFQTLEEVVSRTKEISTLFSIHLPEHLRILQAQSGIISHASPPRFSEPNRIGETNKDNFPTWKESKKIFEKNYVNDLMLQANGKITKACEISGLSRSRLYQLLRKYDPSYCSKVSNQH